MRKALLHCDGARSYRFAKIPGVLTEHVRHKRPRPVYAARWRHKLPRDQKLAHKPWKMLAKAQRAAFDIEWVMKGTQVIDGVWRQLKTKGMPKEASANEQKIDEHVREFQWSHWNAEVDKWMAKGEVMALDRGG